ncbi:hypothetical protein GCM10009116_14910 [Brevundimonas basaltis]|uniref:Glucose dehydrogenase n=1 Tax=Brevundimonas basaltis TaxID=472166 RepID=A0A7W8MGQ6_9CAUL|nr:hypothetical protein [Brevundimonas basaltis]MBB5291196.1 glucose dehydrogenase [Brevundimonas basaltis]
MTVWQQAEILFGLIVYTVVWMRGGPPERLAVGVLLIHNLTSFVTWRWEIEASYTASMIRESVSLLIFGGLWFRSNRWWPAVMAAATCLLLLTYALWMLHAAVAHFAVASARVGLWFLIDLVLLLSVFERWVAGEPPAGSAAWAKAARATAAKRRAASPTAPPTPPRPSVP